MKFTLFAVATLAIVSLSTSVDPECSLRKKSGLDMHWANPESCGRFYRCSRGIKREIICPGDGEYSDVTGKCVPAGQGSCGKNIHTMLLLVSTTPTSCEDAPHGTHIAKPGYCSEFLICYNGVGHEQVCDSGSLYDVNKATCVPDTNAQCWQNTCLKKSDGYIFADPNNCAQFYVCANKQADSQNCDAGSAWSDELDACAPDTQKKCWVNYCVGEADGKRIADESDEHSYYLCENQKTSKQSCGEDTFDTKINDCQAPPTTTTEITTIETTNTVEEVETTTPSLEETTTPCVEETTTPCVEETTTPCVEETTTPCVEKTTTPCVEETTTTCAPVETVTCAGGHKQGDFVGIPDNCMNFNICDNGHLYEYSCGAGNFYDEKQKICELDTEGKCESCQSAMRKRRSVDTTYQNCSCPDGLQQGEFAKHETDCDKFYVCDNGALVESSCGVNNYYDSCNKVCKADTDHTCWPYNYCVNATDGAVFSNPKQCAGYIVCQNQTETYVNCESGDYFNKTTGYCMPDADLLCVNPCVNVSKIEFLPYPTNCSKFYFCNAGTAYVETCVSGFFDTERHLCLENSLCSSNICQGQAEGTTFPVANSTKSFTVCINNIPTVRSCTGDKIFDDTYGICLSNASSNCDSSVCSNTTEYIAFSTIDKNGTQFCVCKDQKAYEYQCPEDYLFNEDFGTCYSNAPCDQTICETAPEYFVTANRNNSHAFCLCSDKKAVSVLCPNDGLFNPKLGSMGECVSNTPVSDPRCDDIYCLSETNFTIFPAKNDDLTGFCFCNNSAADFKNCPQDSTFNTTLEICIADCPADNCFNQTSGYTFAVPNNASDFCYCLNSTTTIKRTCPTKTYFNEASGVCETEPCDVNVCLNSTIANEPFAANERPNSFCVCDGNTPRLFNCTGDNIFKEDLGICVSPSALECDLSLCCNASTNNLYSTPAINNTNAFCYCFGNDSVKLFYCPPGEQYDADLGICVAPTASSDCDCPGGYSQGELIPDLNNCRKYYVCNNGQLEEGDCGSGNFFDNSCNYCKPDVNKQCTQNTDCTCPGGYKQGQMLPNPTDCQQFYVCNDGQLKEMDCGEGNYFDSENSVCVSRVASSRKARSLSVPVNQKTADLSCLPNEKRPVSSNCTEYDICLNGSWKRAYCQPMFYYNQELKTCMEPRDDTICPGARVSGLPACTAQNEGATQLSKSQTCAQYFQCIQGAWHLNYCGKQYYYVPHLNTCLQDVPSDICWTSNSTNTLLTTVNCQDTAVSAFPPNCAMYLLCLNNQWWYQYCPPGMYFNATYNYCLPDLQQHCGIDVQQLSAITAPNSNDCNIEGLQLHYPLHCSTYVRCEKGRWRKFQCNADETFDELLDACVPQSQNDCKNSRFRRACFPGETRPLPKLQKLARKFELNSCTNFYYCHRQQWQLAACLSGFFYENGTCLAETKTHSCVRDVCLNQAFDTLVAHENDCLRYFLCSELGALEMQCPYGSYYDQQKAACQPNQGQCRQLMTDVCAEAMDGQLLPHSTNCSLFYKCSLHNGTQIVQCSKNNYFHVTTQTCLPDASVCPTTAPTCHRHGEKLLHPTYCNIYYACVHDIPFAAECPAKQKFNASLSACHSTIENCKMTHINQILDIQQITLNNNMQCGNNNSLTTQQDAVYNMADLSDCTRYLICHKGATILHDCEPGSYYNRLKAICEPDIKHVCPFTKTIIISTTTASNLIKPITTTTMVTTIINNTKILPFEGATCWQSQGTFTNDESNCNNFYVCLNGKWRHEQCYEGYYFNSTLMQCQSNNNGTLSAITAMCTDKLRNRTELCDLSMDSLPMPGDCRAYIRCTGEFSPSVERCRNGQSYDSILGFCRQNDGTCLLENGVRVGECNGLHGILIRSSTSCRAYYICINGQKIEMNCAEDEYFERNQNLCVKDLLRICPSDSTIIPNDQICLGLNDSTLYPYAPDNCRSYFQCIGGVPRVQECADFMFFDTNTKRCVKEIIKCELPTGLIKNSVKKYDSAIIALAQRAPTVYDEICLNTTIERAFPNQLEKCQSYFVCHLNGTISHKSCALGELFDQQLEKCVPAQNTSCGSDILV